MLSHFSRVQLFATPWTIARQAPLSMGFSRQEYCSEFPFASPGIFLTQGSNLGLLPWQADSLLLRHLGSPIWGLNFLHCAKYLSLFLLLSDS